MTQRASLHQIKRTDINRESFHEQYTMLEKNSAHQREPVQSAGDLPMLGNAPGTQCLVLDENTIYSWNAGIQNWQSVLGRSYEVSKNMKRYVRKYEAEENQKVFVLDFLYTTDAYALDVFVQGIRQDVNKDYEETDERTVTFREALPKGVDVTFATPMVVEGTYGVRAIEKRLKELEHNNYQLMMNQYYSGKPVDVKGLVFDGFLNTNYIDFMKTSQNMEYDPTIRTMRLDGDMLINFYETFDTLSEIDSASTVLMSNSEITLPIKDVYEKAFSDDFSTKDKIDEKGTTAYHDLERQYFTTVDTLAGANHYNKGDFMSTTSNVDKVGFSNSLYMYASANTNGSGYTRETSAYEGNMKGAPVTSVFPVRNRIVLVTNKVAMRVNKWPYNFTNHDYLISSVSSYNSTTGVTYENMDYDSYYGYLRIWPLFPDNNGNNFHSQMVYVSSLDRIYVLNQYSEGSNRYYQRLLYADASGRTMFWTYPTGKPIGLPRTMFGDETSDYTKSTEYISQIGSTDKHILLHVGHKVYFIDAATNTLVKTLDWSDASVKPSTYNSNAKQFTADARYLYFPARKSKDGKTSYFVEVFDIDTGAYVQDIFVSGDQGAGSTSAIHYDWIENRMLLGANYSNWFTPAGKVTNDYNLNTSYSGFYMFESPNKNERYVQSKTFQTNLPVINYKLVVDEQLNLGTIDYYIRLGTDVWTKIAKNTEYTFKNPNGAKTIDVQLRAALRTTDKSVTAPILSGWELHIKRFDIKGFYQSKPKTMSLQNIVGGRFAKTESIPSESTIQWSISYGKDKPSVILTETGEFALPSDLDAGDIVVRAEMGTHNPLLSPVVKDLHVQLYQSDEGFMETTVFEQLEDISEAIMWVTTGSSHEYYKVYASRDGGKIWEPGKRNNVVKTNDGKVEVEWLLPFNLDSVERRKLKLKFEMDGVTEFYQYGAVISPV